MTSTHTTSNEHPNYDIASIEIIDLTMSDGDDEDDNSVDKHYEEQITNTAMKMALMATATTNGSYSSVVFTSSMSSNNDKTSIHGTRRDGIKRDGQCQALLPLKKRKIRHGYNQWWKKENDRKDSTNIPVPQFIASPTSAFERVVRGDGPDRSNHTLRDEQVPKYFLSNTVTTKMIKNKPFDEQNVNLNASKKSSFGHQGNERILEQRYETMNYQNIFSPISQPLQSTTMNKPTSSPEQSLCGTNPPRRPVPSSISTKKTTKKGSATDAKKGHRQHRIRVLVPQRHDVLAGRSGSNFSHPGNIIHRKLVESRKVEYMKSTEAGEKHRIAKDIVTTITKLDPPGRFLRYEHHNNTETVDSETTASTTSFRTPPCGGGGGGSSSGYWCAMDEKSAIEKTKQALRDCSVGMCGIN